MPDPKTILTWVVALPAAIALVATFVALLPWRRDQAVQPWGTALAICAAFVAVFLKLKGIYGGFPPADAQTWLVYLGVPVIVAAVLATVWRKGAAGVTYASGTIL